MEGDHDSPVSLEIDSVAALASDHFETRLLKHGLSLLGGQAG